MLSKQSIIPCFSAAGGAYFISEYIAGIQPLNERWGCQKMMPYVRLLLEEKMTATLCRGIFHHIDSHTILMTIPWDEPPSGKRCRKRAGLADPGGVGPTTPLRTLCTRVWNATQRIVFFCSQIGLEGTHHAMEFKVSLTSLRAWGWRIGLVLSGDIWHRIVPSRPASRPEISREERLLLWTHYTTGNK